MNAARLLLGATDVQRALTVATPMEPAKEHVGVQAIGNVVAAAAVDAAYRSLSGRVTVDGSERPVAVGQLALIFDSTAKSENTFAQVAEAAHLRTRIGECNVAVETVTAPSGLVSYWGFLQRTAGLVVLTLDTVDPQAVSMSTFRAVVSAAAERLEALAA